MNSDEDKLKFNLYKRGYSDLEIAKECGVARCTILNWRKKNNLKTLRGRGQVLSQEEKKRRIELIEKGYNDEQCAAIIGISKQSFTFWRHNNGYRKIEPFINKITKLDKKEQQLYAYLAKTYPEKTDAHLVSLAKYAKPQVNVQPAPIQRKYIKKIKGPGFKAVYYFDDGDYSAEDEAIKMFVELNRDKLHDHPMKLKVNLPKELYQEMLDYLNS